MQVSNPESYKPEKPTYRKRRVMVTCYFRHIKQIFIKAGIEVTDENKREIDRAIHNVVGINYKNCSDAWSEVKKRIAEDEEGFVSKLKETVAMYV